MNLEYTVLRYLNENDTGNLIDVTLIDDSYSELTQKLQDLKDRNLIVTDNCKTRDFEAFGISNQRKKCIKAKINMNGKIHLYSLEDKIREKSVKKNKLQRAWKLSYLFNF